MLFEVEVALGQISGCLDTRLDRLGLIFWGCPESARRVLGNIRREREALLDAFPRDSVLNKFKEKTHASLKRPQEAQTSTQQLTLP